MLLVGTGESRLVDLATAAVVEVPVEADHRPVAVRGGVVVFDGPNAWYRPLPEGEPIDLGPASRGVTVPGDASSIWLLTTELSTTGAAQQSLRLVSVPSGTSTPPVQIRDLQLHGAVGGGIVGSGGGRVYLVGADGSVRPITTGVVLGVSDGVLVVDQCDDEGRCATHAWNRELSSFAVVQLAGGSGPMLGPELVVEPGGTQAVMRPFGASSAVLEMFVIDLLGGPPREIEVRSVESFAWLPDGLGLVLARGSEVVRARDDGAGGFVIDQLSTRGASQVLVVQP